LGGRLAADFAIRRPDRVTRLVLLCPGGIGATKRRSNLRRPPRFSDQALAGLTMPMLVIVGARDAVFDSQDTARRIGCLMPHAVIRWLPDVGHEITGQAEPILAFLTDAAPQTRVHRHAG
jgi:pimeloyl-ACP methyl ester carboxylesterase